MGRAGRQLTADLTAEVRQLANAPGTMATVEAVGALLEVGAFVQRVGRRRWRRTRCRVWSCGPPTKAL